MRKLIYLLLIAWCGVYLLSLLLPFTQEATGDGFTRGSNRIGLFFTWQFVAGLLALAIWRLAKVNSEQIEPKWLTRGPIGLTLGLLAACLVVLLWIIFAKPEPGGYVPPNAPTQAIDSASLLESAKPATRALILVSQNLNQAWPL